MKIVSFGGFNASGGSALRDIFKECKKINLFPAEFRIIRERHGLLDLDQTLFNNKALETRDLAVRDFMWLAKNLAKKGNKFSKNGFAYDFYTSGNFYKATVDFIESITLYSYKMDWHYYDFQKSYIVYMRDKILKRLLNFDTAQNAFAITNNINLFEEAVQKYIKNILINFSCNRDSSILALHNAIPPYGDSNTKRALEMLPEARLIIIDRDPRDIFIDFPNDRYLPSNLSQLERAKFFVEIYKNFRKNNEFNSKNRKILSINFEDIVMNLSSTIGQVEDFLGVSIEYSPKEKIFNPDFSKKNIGRWRNLPDTYSSAIRHIEQKLKAFLN